MIWIKNAIKRVTEIGGLDLPLSHLTDLGAMIAHIEKYGRPLKVETTDGHVGVLGLADNYVVVPELKRYLISSRIQEHKVKPHEPASQAEELMALDYV